MNRPIPVRAHMFSEPALFFVLLLAPFVLDFADFHAARNISIAAAIVVLVGTLLTNWPLSVVRVIPLPVHGVIDIVLGLVLIVAPFALGYSDDSTAAVVVHLILGLGLLVAGFMTNWSGAHDRADLRRRRHENAKR
ncbi:SPW repeat domain-containing protein [Patulibacter americanus]|uniref:SPW repeat domain-containing protein n=1 Tax=Patulibacter americanus TaxID=588672 RepID=UPI0003B642F4|nr:SPW repeat protein [Patulibacter americanus]